MTTDESNVLESIQNEIHAVACSKGWHDDRLADDDLDDYFNRACNNLHNEISELHESWRKDTLDKPCDKVFPDGQPLDLIQLEEELADIVIRAFDMAARLDVNIGRAIRLKHQFNKTRSFRHGGKIG